MAVVTPGSRVTARPATVTVAGAAWPVYKLESLAVAAAAGPIVLACTGSPAAGVLAGAGLAAARWIAAVARRA